MENSIKYNKEINKILITVMGTVIELDEKNCLTKVLNTTGLDQFSIKKLVEDIFNGWLKMRMYNVPTATMVVFLTNLVRNQDIFERGYPTPEEFKKEYAENIFRFHHFINVLETLKDLEESDSCFEEKVRLRDNPSMENWERLETAIKALPIPADDEEEA
jgi:hypothetical protein